MSDAMELFSGKNLQESLLNFLYADFFDANAVLMSTEFHKRALELSDESFDLLRMEVKKQRYSIPVVGGGADDAAILVAGLDSALTEINDMRERRRNRGGAL